MRLSLCETSCPSPPGFSNNAFRLYIPKGKGMHAAPPMASRSPDAQLHVDHVALVQRVQRPRFACLHSPYLARAHTHTHCPPRPRHIASTLPSVTIYTQLQAACRCSAMQLPLRHHGHTAQASLVCGP